MFLGSPEPMKKWHLSAQAPQRTQMSMKTWNERYFSSRSRMPSRMICFQFSGSCQSSSVGDHSRGLGKPMYFEVLGRARVGPGAAPRLEVDGRVHPVGLRRSRGRSGSAPAVACRGVPTSLTPCPAGSRPPPACRGTPPPTRRRCGPTIGGFHGLTWRTRRLLLARLRVGLRKTPGMCSSLENGK